VISYVNVCVYISDVHLDRGVPEPLPQVRLQNWQDLQQGGLQTSSQEGRLSEYRMDLVSTISGLSGYQPWAPIIHCLVFDCIYTIQIALFSSVQSVSVYRWVSRSVGGSVSQLLCLLCFQLSHHFILPIHPSIIQSINQSINQPL